MKPFEIKLSLSQHKEKHSIYIGWNENLLHKSKSFLKKYLKTYKRVLTDNVRILNAYNSQAYSLYRNFYFDLSPLEAMKITQSFADFNSQMNWVFCNGGLSNSVFFGKINSCICSQFEILEILKSHAQRYKNTSLRHQAESHLKMICNFRDQYEAEVRSLDLNRNYSSSLRLINESKTA